jgi:hypothetical protein
MFFRRIQGYPARAVGIQNVSAMPQDFDRPHPSKVAPFDAAGNPARRASKTGTNRQWRN